MRLCFHFGLLVTFRCLVAIVRLLSIRIISSYSPSSQENIRTQIRISPDRARFIFRSMSFRGRWSSLINGGVIFWLNCWELSSCFWFIREGVKFAKQILSSAWCNISFEIVLCIWFSLELHYKYVSIDKNHNIAVLVFDLPFFLGFLIHTSKNSCGSINPHFSDLGINLIFVLKHECLLYLRFLLDLILCACWSEAVLINYLSLWLRHALGFPIFLELELWQPFALVKF